MHLYSVIFGLFICFGFNSARSSSVVPTTGSDSKDTGVWFTKEPEDLVVVAGSSAVLNCQADTSDPKETPSISWRGSDGQIIDFVRENHMRQLPNGSLYINSVLSRPPEILGQGRENEENYRCLASVPSIGTIVSRATTVTLARLPPLSQEPKSLHVYPGQTAYFACKSDDARPQPQATWLKDQRRLIIDESRMVIFPSGSLEIDDVQISDTGTYECNLTSLDGYRVSVKAFLTVSQDIEGAAREMPPEFIATPQDTVTLEGSTVTLDCAANGHPRPWIYWLKDGVQLDMADLDIRYRIIGTGSLQILNVVESDTGNYQCRAENREDSDDTQAILNVHVAPRFTKRPKSIAAILKTDIELECDVYARPDPTIKWLKNGDPISPNSDYLQVVNGNNLRILGVMDGDFGIFQCIASNAAGNIHAAALLTVVNSDIEGNAVAAFAASSTESVLVVAGRSPTGSPTDLEAAVIKPRFVTLRWKPPAASHGKITSYVVYYLEHGSNRERVVNTSRSRLEEANISELRPNTTYAFRVAAVTATGIGAATEPLVVATQPELRVPGPPMNVRAVPSTTSLVVSWSPPLITNGKIQQYKLYYYEYEVSEEHHVDTEVTSYTLTGLKRFTEYIVWVVAFNHNGAGTNSEEIAVKTLSDTPSEPPTNVTVEAASSTSVEVRWEPPPPEGCNGIITGYKLRYRLRDKRLRSETVTTAGNRRQYVITNLEKSSVYQVRIWAMTVNGTGPPTDWYTIETYERDLDESTVPDVPSDLKAKANGDSITVIWSPPKNTNIMVRDYIITWGKGVPDEFYERLEGKVRYHVIKNLEPNSEYVISLRAHNEKGDGQPLYENVRTRAETKEEPVTPLVPPVGLKANVVSPTSVVLFWSDTSLPPDQVVTDGRYYVVRYNQFYQAAVNTRYKFHNSTVLNYMIDDLKPFTQYEFVVKVVYGRRESPWSMMAVNTTWEAVPSSPPRDLTVINVENSPGSVSLSWQPPKVPNGLIIGYVVSYTTDLQSKERDWITETVSGDKMAITIKALSSGTTYYFHVKAKNRKGFSISSPVVSITTPSAYGAIAEIGYPSKGKGGLSSTSIMYIGIVASSVVITLVAIALVFICCRKSQPTSPDRSKKYAKGAGKAGTSHIKPPDLWIHHDQMELKNLEKNQEHRTSTGTLPRSNTGGDSPSMSRGGTLEKNRHHTPGSTEHHHRDYASSYIGSQCQPLLMPEERMSTLRRGSRQKPITLPIDNSHFREPVATATPIGGSVVGSSLTGGSLVSGGSVLTPSDSRPLCPRPQYSISRAHVTVDPAVVVSENPYIVQPTTSITYEPVPSSQPISNYGSSEVKRLQGHPLKSFSVPAPPPQSAPTTPQQKHIVTVRPQGSSPYKKSVPGYSGGLNTSPLPTKSKLGGDELPKIQASYSTEELNQEMANLEGLMKDLNAITASEFQC